LALAMVATWRWDRDDQLPNGRRMGTELFRQIRAALERYSARSSSSGTRASQESLRGPS
jgi:hypothetical protein